MEGLIYPKEVVLEVTNRCNLRCMFCHFHGINAVRKRGIGDMPEKVWRKVVQEISSWEEGVNVATHGAGEPLLYSHLKELLSELRKGRNITFGFMTNGMLLSKEWSEFIVDLGMDWIAFSIDGVDPKKHSYYRRNSDLNRIEKNIETLIELKEKVGSQKPILMFNMVVYPGMEGEKEKFLNRWLPHAKKIMFSKFRPMAKKTLWEKQPFDFTPCPLIFRQFIVGFDGSVALCCEDIHIEHPLGNVLEEDILSIFNGDRIKLVREKHLKGDLEGLKLCSECHVWGAEKVLERKTITKGLVYERTPAYESYERI